MQAAWPQASRTTPAKTFNTASPAAWPANACSRLRSPAPPAATDPDPIARNRSAGCREAPGGRLLGRPILFTEHAKTVGDKGDLQLVNPNGYEAFRKQSGVQFAESIHLYFDYNIRAFRWIFRIGGQPVLSAPVSPAKGSNTKSHFVALADRA